MKAKSLSNKVFNLPSIRKKSSLLARIHIVKVTAPMKQVMYEIVQTYISKHSSDTYAMSLLEVINYMTPTKVKNFASLSTR
jgi:hypothetical protein